MKVEELQAYVDEKFPDLKLRVYPHRQPMVFSAIGDLTYNVAIDHKESVHVIGDRLVAAMTDVRDLLNSQIVQVEIAQREPTKILGVKVCLVGSEYWVDAAGHMTLWDIIAPERVNGEIYYHGIPIIYKSELDVEEVTCES